MSSVEKYNIQLILYCGKLCSEDWLNGYIKSGGKRIPVSLMIEKAGDTNTSVIT